MSAAVNESDAASAATDPRHDPNNLPEGSVMDVSEHIIALADTASEPWSDDLLATFVDIPLAAAPEIPRDHPLFEVEGFDVMKRQRDADGNPVGSYVVEHQEWIIRRRDPESVAALIARHRALVEADEALFNDNGTPLVPQEEVDASEKREREGYFRMIAAPCRTLADVQLKASYLLTGTIGERDEILGGLLPDGTDVRLREFLGSLIVDRRA